jgi:ribosomal protein S18 acetylase RimI-like enzyme
VNFRVRNTQPEDMPAIQKLCETVYPDSPPWGPTQIESHLRVFPQGQFVAEEIATGKVVGFSASLIIFWDDYDFRDSWRDFTSGGMFTNHDPEDGRTLYGAEVMVDPAYQGQGIGKMIYRERENLARRFRLLRIRAGARLRGYCTYASEMSPEEYTIQVIDKKIFDPTLSFQLKNGFSVLSVVSGYLRYDKESLGYAAVIEWINDEVAKPQHYLLGEPKYRRHVP